LRSLLYVPGNSERKVARALQTAADAIILDLEDSIAPGEKEPAREVLSRILRDTDFGSKPVFVRINGMATRYALDDARAVAATGNAGILIPKAELADDAAVIAAILASNVRTGSPSQRLLCLIESPRGVLDAREIAASSFLICGLIFGSADLVREIGSRLTEGEPELFHARSHVLLAARASGVAAYDSPHFVIADQDGLRRTSIAARNLGYDGRTVIHPTHIDIVNELFSNTDEEIKEAERIVAAMDEAAREGRGAISLDGRLVDQVHLAHARKILSRRQGE
jgi:citrate lyase subunit beta/citryl-CoA lyase